MMGAQNCKNINIVINLYFGLEDCDSFFYVIKIQ